MTRICFEGGLGVDIVLEYRTEVCWRESDCAGLIAGEKAKVRG